MGWSTKCRQLGLIERSHKKDGQGKSYHHQASDQRVNTRPRYRVKKQKLAFWQVLVSLKVKAVYRGYNKLPPRTL